MLTSRINFINFKSKSKSKLKTISVKKKLKLLFKEKNEIIKSLSTDYKNAFSKKTLHKYKKSSNFRVIGMGGSSLGTKAIYDFLKTKINKKFTFIDNLQPSYNVDKKKIFTNLIISKSGNTIETIANANVLVEKKDKNIFITENKKNYLYFLAEKLKADIIHHNNYIGGRYSVLSEVGMLPAELMGLNSNNFRSLNLLIKNKNFMNSLIANVNSTIQFIKKKNLIQ